MASIGGAHTVRVSNVSSKATTKEIQEFFSFSGQIEKIGLSSDGVVDSQIAHVTFKDEESVRIALMLSGSTILDKEVSISTVTSNISASGTQEVVTCGAEANEVGASTLVQGRQGPINRAQEIVRAMLLRGFAVGKDAVRRVNSLPQKGTMSEGDDDDDAEKNGESNPSGEVRLQEAPTENRPLSGRRNSFDSHVHAEEVIQVGNPNMGGMNNVRVGMQKCYKHVSAINEKLQLGQRTMTALTMAQQGVSSAGSAVAGNKFISAGGNWVSGALSRVTTHKATKNGEDSPAHGHEQVQLTEMTSLPTHKSTEEA